MASCEHRNEFRKKTLVLVGVLQVEAHTCRSVSYIVYFPHSNYLLASGLAAAHKKFILQSLLIALNSSDIKDHKLQGKDMGTCLISCIYNIESLKKMLTDLQGKNTFNFKSDSTKNPLDRSLGSLDTKPREAKEAPNVVIEDKCVMQERLKVIETTFPEGQPPTIEVVKYKNIQPIQSTPTLALSVEFTGTSVLGGYQELVKFGLVKTPLPECLTKPQQTGKNTFVYSSNSN